MAAPMATSATTQKAAQVPELQRAEGTERVIPREPSSVGGCSSVGGASKASELDMPETQFLQHPQTTAKIATSQMNGANLTPPKAPYPWGTTDALRNLYDKRRNSAEPDDFIPCDAIRNRSPAYQSNVWDLIHGTQVFDANGDILHESGADMMFGERIRWQFDHICEDPSDCRHDPLDDHYPWRIRVWLD